MKAMKLHKKVIWFVVIWLAIMGSEMALAFLGRDPATPILNVIVALLAVEVLDLRRKRKGSIF
ncbi:MAG: hypothetical protein DRO99_04305 [Candidatus Aenigmatarchaeota archaeon]|nr:MAG: hypothetical protein DRO99_04305 [Candidatus Aenigmarchaeota archaeon]